MLSSPSQASVAGRSAQRWSDKELQLLQQVRQVCAPALALQPSYPEVVGDRRLIRFIRGQQYNIEKISAKVFHITSFMNSFLLHALCTD